MREYAVMPLQDYKDTCDKIREKTTTTENIKSGEIPQKIEGIYEAGQKSMIDESKIIEKKVSGKGSVTLTDVSEVPHTITARVGGSNTLEVDGITYTATGEGVPSKNLLKYPYVNSTATKYGVTFKDFGDGGIEVSGTPTTNYIGYTLQREIAFEDGKTYSISYPISIAGFSFVMAYYNENGAVIYLEDGSTITWKKEYKILEIYIQITTSFNGTPTKIYPMINEGTTALPYEPYTTWYEIDNIKSNSPNMLFNGGDYLEVNYHKSWGMQTEYDRFWDSFQKQGTRKAYRYGFAGRGWTDDTFKPKYDIVPNPYEAIYMFAQSEVIDLEQCLVNCGVKLDLSKVVNALSLFEDCTLLTRIPTIDLSAVTNFPNTFKSCTSLLEIRFEGVIGSNVSFQDSPLLTHESLMSIINALKNFSVSKIFDVNNVSQNGGTYDGDYRGDSFKATNCTLNGTTLSVEGINEGGTIIFKVENADITADEVTRIVSFVYTPPLPESEFIVNIAPATKKTLTLGATNLAKLTDSEKAIATQKGWTIA